MAVDLAVEARERGIKYFLISCVDLFGTLLAAFSLGVANKFLEPATGAVLMSELDMRSAEMDATITVSYQSEPLLGFRVPIAMQEQYRGKREHVDAIARYGRFRQFQVTTSERIGKPPGR